jgi:hypothetical protein
MVLSFDRRYFNLELLYHEYFKLEILASRYDRATDDQELTA